MVHYCPLVIGIGDRHPKKVKGAPEGMSINDVRRFSAIFDLPTMSDDFYPITSHIWELFWTPLPTLKSDVIYGCSHRNFIPAPLASQSAPLMNTCWPVLRTCNSNTFVLFLSFLYSKKEFLQPKNHSSSNHVFKKIFSSSEKEKNLCKLRSYFLYNQTKQNRNVFSVQILRHFYKAPCEIKSVRC